MKKTYALIGCGYVAPKHYKAIKETGGELLAICDSIHDVVGTIDSFFPNCEFFRNGIDFEKYCLDNNPDYLVVCTPNYMHKKHSYLGLSMGMNVICEKPIALYPSDLEELKSTELSTGKKINTILQLRLNPTLQGLKCEIEQSKNRYECSVVYRTLRGPWYQSSWKGNDELSGGLAQNIGIHLFDTMIQLLGPVQEIKLHTKTPTEVSGELFQERGHTTFLLSIDGVKTERTLKIGNREIEFSRGFQDAHVRSYDKIIRGEGFGLTDALPSIILCDKIRKLGIS